MAPKLKKARLPASINAPPPAGLDRPLADIVYESIRRDIQSRRLLRGQRIREEEVAASLGVSRTPVREALRRLLTTGLLQISGARGLVVSELTNQLAVELFVLREILEGAAARFAAQHAGRAEIVGLHHLLEKFTANMNNLPSLLEANHKIHGAIYEASRNRFLIDTLNRLQDNVVLLQGTSFSMQGRAETADKEHRLIVAAIERHDGDAAEEAARSHIRNALACRMEAGLTDS